MRPDPEVEDSQIVECDYDPPEDDFDFDFEPPPSHQPDHIGHGIQPAHRDGLRNVDVDQGISNSIVSRIEETQFHSIELSHEDSVPSVVDDTQYTEIESATQIPTQGVENIQYADPVSPDLDKFTVPVAARSFSDNLSKPSFLTRPKESVEDSTEGFSFAQAPKAPSFSRVIGNKSKSPPYAAETISVEVQKPMREYHIFPHLQYLHVISPAEPIEHSNPSLS